MFSPLSSASLYVEAVMLGRGPDATERSRPATAFLVGPPHDLVLITARHVLAGEDMHGSPIDQVGGARPDVLRVHLHDPTMGERGKHILQLPLWEDEAWDVPLFQSHPDGPSIDVAAIRLGYEPGPEVAIPFDTTSKLRISDLWNDEYGDPPAQYVDSPIPLRVMDRVSIIGFPFGDSGTWPTGIWTTGFVASEPLVRYNGDPAFLIDARTREGLSGAPVVRYIRPSDPVTDMHDSVIVHDRHLVELLGVYSGRLHRQADLGRCVSVDALGSLLDSLPERTFFDPDLTES